MKTFLSAIGLALVLACTYIPAQEESHHHSHSAGPAAPNSAENVGMVSFPTSCAAPMQKAMERGVALLHSFEYESADAQFKQVAQKDPQCSMAYWGEALSLYHQLWSRPSHEDMNRGWELVQKAQSPGAKTQRERDYIDALAAFYRDHATIDHEKRSHAYAAAMEKVYRRYPQDHEAAAFYALSLLASSNEDSNENAGLENNKQAIAILNHLFLLQPKHPGIAHYLIHSCDNPKFASEGLAAARSYATIAPSSPHAVHMPSHIFARLGLWQEDIQSNLAAIDVAEKQTAMHTMHHRMHSMDFLEYAYLQIGENGKARGMVDKLATFKKADVETEFKDYFDAMAAGFPARYALETRQWKDALELKPIAGAGSNEQAITFWAQAVAAGHLRDAAAARSAVNQYDALLAATSKGDRAYRAKYMETDRDEAHAWLNFAEGKNDEAVRLLRPVADKQDATGKGEVELPAREMLGDMLLEMNRPQEALVEYEQSLHTDPNRFNGLYGAGRAAEMAHQPAKAAHYYAQLLKNCDHADASDRPELARAKTLLAQK